MKELAFSWRVSESVQEIQTNRNTIKSKMVYGDKFWNAQLLPDNLGFQPPDFNIEHLQWKIARLHGMMQNVRAEFQEAVWHLDK